MGRRLAAHIHVHGEDGATTVYGPGDAVPADVAKTITNPDAWETGDVEAPKGNASLEVWQEYALAQGASQDDVEGMTRDDLRDLYA